MIFRLETEPLSLECVMTRSAMTAKLMGIDTNSTAIGLRQRLSPEAALNLVEALLAVPEVAQEVIRRQNAFAAQIVARQIAEAN